MFQFENPYYLLALVAIPILLGLFLFGLSLRKNAIQKLGDAALVKRLMPEYSRYREWGKFLFFTIAIAFIAVAWANPQWGTKKETVKRKSTDVFIAMDISNSMDVTDIAPTRLDRAKRFGQRLIDQLSGDRVGIIIFAGNAHIHSPLTTDYNTAKMLLESVNTKQILTQGTAIKNAIDLAEMSYDEDDEQHKALIIISDGENHDQGAVERATQALGNNILVFTVGAGTKNGGYIPLDLNGYNDYKRDNTGQLIKSKLNEEMLSEISKAGGGAYYNVAAGEDQVLAVLKDRISQIEKKEFEARMFEEHESYFWIFLIPAILLLIIEFVLSYRKGNILSGKDFFSR